MPTQPHRDRVSRVQATKATLATRKTPANTGSAAQVGYSPHFCSYLILSCFRTPLMPPLGPAGSSPVTPRRPRTPASSRFEEEVGTFMSPRTSTQASQAAAAANFARFLPLQPAGASHQALTEATVLPGGSRAQAPNPEAVQQAGQHRQPGPAPGADHPISVRTRKLERKR